MNLEPVPGSRFNGLIITTVFGPSAFCNQNKKYVIKIPLNVARFATILLTKGALKSQWN